MAAHDEALEKQVVQWVEAVGGESIGPLTFSEWLNDGTVLCNLVNKIKPGTIKGPSTMKAPAKKMENITLFTDAVRALGVPGPAVFATPDLYEEKNLGAVLQCIIAFAAVVQTAVPDFDGPKLECSAQISTFLGSGPYNARFQQTMLRIKDPKVSVPWYIESFGMTLIHWIDFPQWKFTVYFLEVLAEGQQVPPCTLEKATKESEQYLFTMAGHAIELTHNHGSEEDPLYKTWNGNTGKDAIGANYAEEPAYRGFGHIGFNCDDVQDAVCKLQEKDVPIYKRPSAGKTKGHGIVLDPDGYRIEIHQRKAALGWSPYYNLSQTMLRVKDGPKSVEWYTKHMGFTLVDRKVVDDKYSVFRLASLTQKEVEEALKLSGEGADILQDPSKPNGLQGVLFHNVLTLFWNHGTESNPDFKAHDGNAQPQGFGHIGLIMDNLTDACAKMEADGVSMKKRPSDGNMRDLAFVYDPDGYWVELIDRKASFAGICANY